LLISQNRLTFNGQHALNLISGFPTQTPLEEATAALHQTTSLDWGRRRVGPRCIHHKEQGGRFPLDFWTGMGGHANDLFTFC